MSEHIPAVIQTKVAEYSVTAEALVLLDERYRGKTYAVTTEAGLEEATKARNELRKLRTALEAKRKELKAPALERSRLIDDEAKRITEAISELEDPIAEQIAAEAKRQEREKLAAEAKEKARVENIERRLSGIIGTPAQAARLTSAQIEQGIEALLNDDLAWADERAKDAAEATANAVAAMRGLAIAAKDREAKEAAEAARQRDRDAELARLKAEADERARQDAARAMLEAEAKAKREAEQRERERLEAEAEAARQREQAEREAKIRAEERARAEAEEKRLREERERLEEAERKRQAEARAEQERLAAERRELERQQNEILDGDEMLQAFVNRFSHRREYFDVLKAVREYFSSKG